MGIKGLNSFLRQHNILREEKFHDTKIIIDGYGLMYFLATKIKLDSKYGGNYGKFRKGIDDFFDNLKLCNIDHFVVLDGCKLADDSKLKTQIRRHESKLSESINGLKPNRRSFPLLMRQEFKKGLERNKVLCNIRHFEADDALVELANYFDCYILSADTDYFIHNLKKAAINIFTIKFDYDIINKKNVLKGKVFFIQNLNSKFPNLNHRLLALAGMLIGNDYLKLPDEKLQELLGEKKYEVPVKRQKLEEISSNNPFKNTLMKIFSWLNNIGNYDKALILIRQLVPKKIGSLLNKLELHIQKYTVLQLPSEKIKDDLSNYKDSSSVKTLTGREIPGKYPLTAFINFKYLH